MHVLLVIFLLFPVCFSFLGHLLENSSTLKIRDVIQDAVYLWIQLIRKFDCLHLILSIRYRTFDSFDLII